MVCMGSEGIVVLFLTLTADGLVLMSVISDRGDPVHRLSSRSIPGKEAGFFGASIFLSRSRSNRKSLEDSSSVSFAENGTGQTVELPLLSEKLDVWSSLRASEEPIC